MIMRLLSLLVCFFLFPYHSPAQPIDASKTPIAISDVTIVDVVEGKLIPDQTIIISGQQITGLGHADSFSIPGHATIIDAKGKYLIPGLWDMHVHLDDKPGLYFTNEDKQITLDVLIAHGIVGVRDMGGNLRQLAEWKRQATNQQILVPHIIAAGPYVDGTPPLQPHYTIPLESAKKAQFTVRDLSRNAGVDFIKVYGNLNREAYFAIAEEANKLGIPFAGHLPSSVKLEEAIEAGQRSFEHGDPISYLCTEQTDKFQEIIDNAQELEQTNPKRMRASMISSGYDQEVIASFNPKTCNELLTKLSDVSTWYTPTHPVFKGFTHFKDSPPEDDPRYQILHPLYKNLWEQRVNAIPDSIKQKPEFAQANQAFFESRFKITRALHDAGVALLAGTDMPDMPYIFPGSSLYDELEFMVRGGLTPAEALRTATLNPAQYLGREYEMGTVAVANTADLVLLNDNPLADINNVREIHAVVLKGKLLNRSTLDSMLNEIKNKVQKYKNRE